MLGQVLPLGVYGDLCCVTGVCPRTDARFDSALADGLLSSRFISMMCPHTHAPLSAGPLYPACSNGFDKSFCRKIQLTLELPVPPQFYKVGPSVSRMACLESHPPRVRHQA